VAQVSLRFPWLLPFSVFVLASPLRATETDSRITDLARLRAGRVTEAQAFVARGVVTALSGWKNSFFLQDATGGISVDRLEQTPVSVGDVLVRGNLRPGLFTPLILSSSVTVMGKSPLPLPQTPSYEELADGSFDSRWIEVRGVVHSAQIETVWAARFCWRMCIFRAGPSRSIFSTMPVSPWIPLSIAR